MKNIINRKAMSLIEVMIALGIFSMVSLITISGTTTGFKIKSKIDREYDFYQTVRTVFAHIERDLSLAFHSMSDTNLAEKNKMNSIYLLSESRVTSFFIGNRERIDFTSLSHFRKRINSKESSNCEVAYFLESDLKDSSSYNLIKREDHIVDEEHESGGVKHILATGIKELSFKFFTIQGGLDGGDGNWEDTWNSNEGEHYLRFPEAVEITIIFNKDKGKNEEKEEQTFKYKVKILSPNNFK